MGFKQVDLVPVATIGPTVLTPTSKGTEDKIFQVTRSDTAVTLKTVLPSDASITSISFYPSVASNAATTASVAFVISNDLGTISTGSVDVKNTTTISAVGNLTNLPNLEPIPPTGDIKITAQYSESGTASTTGGPWRFVVRYVR